MSDRLPVLIQVKIQFKKNLVGGFWNFACKQKSRKNVGNFLKSKCIRSYAEINDLLSKLSRNAIKCSEMESTLQFFKTELFLLS